MGTVQSWTRAIYKGKTMKQHYNFGKAITSKMTKNQFIEYLNKKKVEIES